MKKIISALAGLCLGMLLMSCSSLPKNVEPGANVTAGRLIMECRGYFAKYGSYEGVHKTGLSVTFTNKETGEAKVIKCNKDGYFCTTELIPNVYYYVSEVRYTTTGAGGTSWIYQTFEDNCPFFVYDMTITNLGEFSIIMKKDEGCSWTLGSFEQVEQYFINPTVMDTVWEKVDIVRKNPTNRYEEWIKR